MNAHRFPSPEAFSPSVCVTYREISSNDCHRQKRRKPLCSLLSLSLCVCDTVGHVISQATALPIKNRADRPWLQNNSLLHIDLINFSPDWQCQSNTLRFHFISRARSTEIQTLFPSFQNQTSLVYLCQVSLLSKATSCPIPPATVPFIQGFFFVWEDDVHLSACLFVFLPGLFPSELGNRQRVLIPPHPPNTAESCQRRGDKKSFLPSITKLTKIHLYLSPSNLLLFPSWSPSLFLSIQEGGQTYFGAM